MKKSILVLCMLFAAAGVARADVYYANAKVKNVRVHSLASSGADMDWIALEGFSVAGASLAHGGVVVLRVRDDERGKRQLATAMAAKLAGSPVEVGVNDAASNRDQYGYCYLNYIDLQAQ